MSTFSKSFLYGSRAISTGLSCLIFCQSCISPAPAQTLPTAINIVVIEGEGAINNVRERVTREPLVLIEDENHKPVSGAAVVFTLPTEGASGDFPNGSKTLTMVTDPSGKAMAKGLRPNGVAGKLPIYVTASYRGLSTRITITQVNEGVAGAPSGPSGGGNGKIIALLLLAGGAAAGGAVFATRKKGSQPVTPPTVPPIGIAPGNGSIAPPR